MQDALSLQFARYEMSDEDIMSVILTGKVLQKQIADLTGKSETFVSKLSKIASYGWLRRAVKHECVSLDNATKLIDATGKQPGEA